MVPSAAGSIRREFPPWRRPGRDAARVGGYIERLPQQASQSDAGAAGSISKLGVTRPTVARGDLALEVDLESDTAPLGGLTATLLDATDGVRCLRDPTRGGVATVLAELALSTELAIAIDEAALPIVPAVNGASEILGLDPLYVANEGKLLAIVAPEAADDALAALRSHPLGADAAVIAEMQSYPPGLVILETAFGGSRVVDMLAGDPLPRIC